MAAYSLPGVSGGSALLRAGERLLAVHDDAFRLTWISLPDLDLTSWILEGDGAPLAKAVEPDFECAVATADGLIHVLGSGATPARCGIARIDIGRSAVALVESPEIYASVRAALDLDEGPNIEGAIVDGERLRLFHRGIGNAPSSSVDLPLAALYGSAPRALGTRSFDLGELGGIRLTLTDAALISERRTAFVATAEDAADAVLDGPVAGSAIGVVEDWPDHPAARWTPLLEYGDRLWPHKVEGFVLDADLRGAWLLTDADDPRRPALLGRVELVGF